jgi:hypothetical protein
LLEPVARHIRGFCGAVTAPAGDQAVREPGDAETDAPLAPRLLRLLGKGKPRNLDDIVEEPDRRWHQG